MTPQTRRRPARGATRTGLPKAEARPATTTSASTAESTADRPQTPDTDDWARREIARADGPIPGYGTAAFEQLPDGPTKTAAAVIAAQRWRHRRVLETATARRAREIAEARQPRPGDYCGGPVSWDGGAA